MNEKVCQRCKKPIALNFYCSACFELKNKLRRIGMFDCDIDELFDSGASELEILREIEIQLLNGVVEIARLRSQIKDV